MINWTDEVLKMNWKVSPSYRFSSPNSELRTPNCGVSSPNSEPRTPNVSASIVSLDEALRHAESSPPGKVLFEGERTGRIPSYVAGWMASHRIGGVVLDGANRFDPYTVSSFAKRASISPEILLKKIRIARAFTCYQMATLMGEKLTQLFKQEHTIAQRPWVILLGPIATFLDEDVPERDVGPLFERSLKKLQILAEEGVSFFLFQDIIPARSKRAYLMKRLFQFSSFVWKIYLDDDGAKVALEKQPIGFPIAINPSPHSLLPLEGAE